MQIGLGVKLDLPLCQELGLAFTIRAVCCCYLGLGFSVRVRIMVMAMLIAMGSLVLKSVLAMLVLVLI